MAFESYTSKELETLLEGDGLNEKTRRMMLEALRSKQSGSRQPVTQSRITASGLAEFIGGYFGTSSSGEFFTPVDYYLSFRAWAEANGYPFMPVREYTQAFWRAMRTLPEFDLVTPHRTGQQRGFKGIAVIKRGPVALDPSMDRKGSDAWQGDF